LATAIRLKWGTAKQNREDAIKNGRHVGFERRVGQDVRGAKLKDEDVLTIRWMWKIGRWTQGCIGRMFGVGHNTISRIVRGEQWTHLLEVHNGDQG
jgi:hypothetical protein